RVAGGAGDLRGGGARRPDGPRASLLARIVIILAAVVRAQRPAGARSEFCRGAVWPSTAAQSMRSIDRPGMSRRRRAPDAAPNVESSRSARQARRQPLPLLEAPDQPHEHLLGVDAVLETALARLDGAHHRR